MSPDIWKEYREYWILHQSSCCVINLLLRDKVVVREAYSQPYQTTNTERFVNIVNDGKPLTI